MGFGSPTIPGTGGFYARSATRTVAASNSIDKINVDYVCDGVDDQVEINAAITALGATGGTVMLLEGQYNITGSINLATLTTLMGQGAGTVLRVPNGFNANLNVISAVSINRVIVADLRIDGNRANQAAGIMNGIYFNTVTYSTIARCWVENLRNDGIILVTSSNNTVAGNTYQSNGRRGIYLNISSNNNTITGNNCQSNVFEGILLSTSSNNNTITGNTYQSNGRRGIYIWNSNNNTITGNTCQGNGFSGIYLSTSSNNTVTGNTVVGTSQDTDNTYDGISATINSDYNNIQGNTVRHAGGANQHRYGIRINAADCDGNLVIDNDLYLAGRTLDYSDAGTGTIYHNNRTTLGWVP